MCLIIHSVRDVCEEPFESVEAAKETVLPSLLLISAVMESLLKRKLARVIGK